MYKNSHWGKIITICSETFTPFFKHAAALSDTLADFPVSRWPAGAALAQTEFLKNFFAWAGVACVPRVRERVLFLKAARQASRWLLCSVFVEMSEKLGRQKQQSAKQSDRLFGILVAYWANFFKLHPLIDSMLMKGLIFSDPYFSPLKSDIVNYPNNGINDQ